MIVRCPDCHRTYDDAACWTICPHGPLWASPSSYCPAHDLIDCPHHAPVGDADGKYGLLTAQQVHRYLGAVRVFLDGIEITDVITADDRQGWLVRFGTYPPVSSPLHPDEPLTELLCGDVRIEVKP